MRQLKISFCVCICTACIGARKIWKRSILLSEGCQQNGAIIERIK